MKSRTVLMSLATICSLSGASKAHAERVDQLSSARAQLSRLLIEVIPDRARRVSSEGHRSFLVRQEGSASLHSDATEVFAVYDINYRYSFATEDGIGESVQCHGEARVYQDGLRKPKDSEVELENTNAFSANGRSRLVANLLDLNCEIVNR